MGISDQGGRIIGLSIAIWILANLVLAGIWDLYCLFFQPDRDFFVSSYLTRWAHDFPVGTLAVGILLGHLLWQTLAAPVPTTHK